MSKEILVHGPMQASNQVFSEKKVPIYRICIERDYDKLPQIIENLDLANHKVMVITDSNVGKFHLPAVEAGLRKRVKDVYSYVMEAGEGQKNLDTVAAIYEELIHHQFDRNDVLFALGGGVVGDITGFAAASYLRGIRFVQLPTSLLAMVDSSIGGKTGVDFRAYKNMIGAFHQPQAVYINLSVLDTLPEREYISGFGEIIKHGLIKSQPYTLSLGEQVTEALDRNLDTMEEIIYQSCLIKQQVVENDPTEKGERALLNFGHTVGHAIEKRMNFTLLHGECVALGMAAAAYISWLRGMIEEEDLEEVIAMIRSYHLPVILDPSESSQLQPGELLSIIRHDKKMVAGQIHFILLKETGNACIDSKVTEDEMRKAISFIMGETIQ